MRPLQILILTLTTGLAATVAATDLAPPAQDERRMQVFLDQREVGLHRFRFDHDGSALQVHSEAEFQVRIAFVTLFRYNHEATERWEEGCLVALQSQTDENGRVFEVDGRRDVDGLRVATRDGGHDVTADCPWSFAYWTPGLRERQLLLNPQDGALLAVDFEPLGPRTLQIGGREVAVNAWRLHGRSEAPASDTEVEIVIYYDADDRWAGLDSKVASGRTLSYRPAPGDAVFPGS